MERWWTESQDGVVATGVGFTWREKKVPGSSFKLDRTASQIQPNFFFSQYILNFRGDEINDLVAFPARDHQPGPSKNRQMMGHLGLGHLQGIPNLGNTALSLKQEFNNFEARLIAQRL